MTSKRVFYFGIGMFFPLFSILGLSNVEEVLSPTQESLIFVLQLSIIVLAGKFGTVLARFLRLPSSLGQIFLGVLLGPYALGSLALLGNTPLFPLYSFEFPVNPSLYGLATFSSVLLLFMAGLETNLKLFIRFFGKGSFIGTSEVLLSFFGPALVASFYYGDNLISPIPLFLGAISASTSVSIATQVLSARKKMGMPESVTILSSAIVDDILGIISLATVVGILRNGGQADLWSIAQTFLYSVGFLLITGSIGFGIAKSVGRFLKTIEKDRSYIAVLSLTLAALVGIFFEEMGLSVIIGAYLVGLSLSRTDINYVIQDKLHSLMLFFTPFFFTIMGMLVDPRSLLSTQILYASLTIGTVAILAKVLGAGIPALLSGFNFLGALRIGLGLVPRGEVALIAAGIGVQQGFISIEIFTLSLSLMLLTTLISTPLLNLTLSLRRSGLNKESEPTADDREISFNLPSVEIARLVSWHLQNSFETEGFFVHSQRSLGREEIYVRKENYFMVMNRAGHRLSFACSEASLNITKTFIHETFVVLAGSLGQLEKILQPSSSAYNTDHHNTLPETSPQSKELSLKTDNLLKKLLQPQYIIFLKAIHKQEVLHELLYALVTQNPDISQDQVYKDVLAREKAMTTGMPGGIALPHAKSPGIKTTQVILGISKKGVEFDALDQEKSYIFALIISPDEKTSGTNTHLEVMAGIVNLLRPHCENLKKTYTAKEAYDLLFNSK